ncbi:hypothetical protein N7449_004373 [Penicillium cf. viridicatum]|uniref:Uncharacterized protein n=1 Tax=Penicillium cf. viridicatum TaxID=2972119 RepID=A0A9W9SXX1_9EURO|nr:hypothetical protein N7449_004373 [Penicillium cf. viridicatum]
MNPGPWAEYAMTVPWKAARNARKIKTRAIALLKEATLVREPLQRSTTHYTGKRLDERIGSKAANVESVLIRINDGPWAKCIRFHNIDRVVTGCGNCQWNGRAACYDFSQLPLTPETSRGHQRNRSSQSSMEIRVFTHHEKAESGLAATERLEQYVRRMQVEADNFAELVVPDRAFIPRTTADDHQAQFDRILSMVNSIKEQLVTIQRT